MPSKKGYKKNFPIKKCWKCGKEDASVHKAKVITATGFRELDLCDDCHMYWGD